MSGRCHFNKRLSDQGIKPVPAFLTPEEIGVTIRNRQKKLISNPNRSLPNSHPQPSKPQTDPSENVAAAVPEKVGSEWQTVTSKKSRSRARKSADQEKVGGEWQTVTSKNSRSRAMRSADQEMTAARDLPPAKPSIEEAMGHFGPLPQEALTKIMCMLSTEDLSSISRTCRGLKAASEDGYLWKLLLHRHFPATSLNAASMEDWKHVFVLQQSNIIESLVCFHTKCTYEEEVLGFPISFTVNPTRTTSTTCKSISTSSPTGRTRVACVTQLTIETSSSFSLSTSRRITSSAHCR
jgi:hypothetical protein